MRSRMSLRKYRNELVKTCCYLSHLDILDMDDVILRLNNRMKKSNLHNSLFLLRCKNYINFNIHPNDFPNEYYLAESY